MFSTARKTVATVAALGALALGGSAIAGAAQNSSSTTTQGTQTAQGQPPGGGPHVGANGKQEQPLSGDTADKVKAAALDKVPGGTVLRVESGGPSGSAYHARARKADGTEVVVLVNSSFDVTSVETMGHP